MQCNCGRETTSSSHEVTTLKKAKEWYSDTTNVPLKIEQDTCQGCGRLHYQVIYNENIIYSHG